MYNEIIAKKNKIAVLGLGYVGLPLALAFARKVSVIGFDIKADRVAMLQQKQDPSNEISSSEFDGCDISFTYQTEHLRQAQFFIVAVPTPIDIHLEPDLKPLVSACNTIGSVLKKGDYVVFESTVYPGCTEEDCIPILEQKSGLKFIQDFKVGFSPERINPGDKVHTLEKVIKITSGCDSESSEEIAKIYELIVSAGVHRASSIKVAEAAKIIENTQRDVNIALMNELAIIFNTMNINTFEVLEAAGTKWNFQKYYPGLVGGHCIGVDPYYLVYKARALGYHPQVIASGRSVNDSMAAFIAQQLVKLLIDKEKNPRQSKVLVLGITFKENVSDIRNSKVVDLINELKSFKVNVDVADPKAVPHEVHEEYGIDLVENLANDYDGIVVAVAHSQYRQLTEDYFLSISSPSSVLVDVKGIYRDKINNLAYWSL